MEQPLTQHELWKRIRAGEALVIIGETLRYEMRIEGANYVVYAGTDKHICGDIGAAIVTLVTLAGDVYNAPSRQE